MRACYVSSEFAPTDGWGRYAREVVRAAHAAGLQPVVATTSAADVGGLGAVEVHRVLPGVPYRPVQATAQLVMAPPLRRVLSTCDVGHLLIEPYLPLFALAAPSGLPLVMTAHGTYAVRPFARPASRWLYGPALRRLDLLVCQSQATLRAMEELTSVPEHVVLPGGVALDAISSAGDNGTEDGRRWSDIDEVPPGAPVVLTVGAVKPRKGHDAALDALTRAARVTGELHWVVVGSTAVDAPWFEALEQRARRDTGVYVHWRGLVADEDLEAWYRRASVFLLLPREHGGSFEGLGLVLLEAAARGLPSVTWAMGGAPEAVVDGVTGVVVDAGDVDAAADALASLLRDPARRRVMGEAGRAFARERSWTALAVALASRYADLARRKRGVGAAP